MVMGKRVLITGASGLLGKYLTHSAPAEYNVQGTWFTSMLPSGYVMDVTDDGNVINVFDKFQPEFVIHCAAIGSVDYCQRHWKEAFDVNVLGVQRMLKACRDYGSKVVFISTNAVFDGNHPPYSEEDDRDPVNTYGKHKVMAEDAVKAYAGKWLIFRPIMLYGTPYKGGRGNWVTRVLDFMCNGHKLQVVDDIITQPTYVQDLADLIWEMLPEEEGIWNVGSEKPVTLYDFALQVAYAWEMDSARCLNLIVPAKSYQFNDLAPRPTDTTYSLDKLRGYLTVKDKAMPSNLKEGLMRMRSE